MPKGQRSRYPSIIPPGTNLQALQLSVGRLNEIVGIITGQVQTGNSRERIGFNQQTEDVSVDEGITSLSRMFTRLQENFERLDQDLDEEVAKLDERLDDLEGVTPGAPPYFAAHWAEDTIFNPGNPDVSISFTSQGNSRAILIGSVRKTNSTGFNTGANITVAQRNYAMIRNGATVEQLRAYDVVVRANFTGSDATVSPANAMAFRDISLGATAAVQNFVLRNTYAHDMEGQLLVIEYRT